MDENERPLVSIGMPVRNCQETLQFAIRSLLEQTYPHWELLLIDDGSSDETLRVAQRFTDSRIKTYSDGESRGLSARLNRALAMSRGKYFARMDGDDVAYPERLERQVSYLEQHPDVDLVGAWVIVFDQAGTPLGKRAGPEAHSAICARPFAGFPLAHPTYVGRLEWFRRYRYSEVLPKSQDQELLLRSYRFSRFANVPEILLAYREERIDLKKILTSRHFLVCSLFNEFQRQKRLALALRALAEQTVKAVVDCIAVGTGLNYRILRHRALPITSEEQQEWARVWASVNRGILA